MASGDNYKHSSFYRDNADCSTLTTELQSKKLCHLLQFYSETTAHNRQMRCKGLCWWKCYQKSGLHGDGPLVSLHFTALTVLLPTSGSLKQGRYKVESSDEKWLTRGVSGSCISRRWNRKLTSLYFNESQRSRRTASSSEARGPGGRGGTWAQPLLCSPLCPGSQDAGVTCGGRWTLHTTQFPVCNKAKSQHVSRAGCKLR